MKFGPRNRTLKVTCQNCGYEQPISEGTVRNLFKIMCEKCQEYITVRGLESDLPSQDDDEKSAVKLDSGMFFHIAITPEDIRSLSSKEVKQYLHNGAINRDTYVWREGLNEWTQLKDVPEYPAMEGAPKHSIETSEDSTEIPPISFEIGESSAESSIKGTFRKPTEALDVGKIRHLLVRDKQDDEAKQIATREYPTQPKDVVEMLEKHFPGYMPEEEYINRTFDVLNSRGFTDPNTIACVAVCRDEITRPFMDGVQEIWGESFNFCGLAGMLFLGKTGFFAAQNHAPMEFERPRYAFYCLTHIGMTEDGVPGQCTREGQQEPSACCSALINFREEMMYGNVNLELDSDDFEMSILKHHLYLKIPYGTVPDLISLTKLTYEQIVEDAERMIKLTYNPDNCHWALLTGIQIHCPHNATYVWPGTTYAVIDGNRNDFLLK